MAWLIIEKASIMDHTGAHQKIRPPCTEHHIAS